MSSFPGQKTGGQVARDLRECLEAVRERRLHDDRPHVAHFAREGPQPLRRPRVPREDEGSRSVVHDEARGRHRVMDGDGSHGEMVTDRLRHAWPERPQAHYRVSRRRNGREVRPEPAVEEVVAQVLHHRGDRGNGEPLIVSRAHPCTAVVVGEVSEPARVVEMRMGQEHVPDLELLPELEGRCDTPRLEEDRTVQQETGQVPLRRGPALAAEHSEFHGEHHSEEGHQGALESAPARIKEGSRRGCRP